MMPHVLKPEGEFEPICVLWRKFLPFWVTVLSGILLCIGYLISFRETGATGKIEEILPAAPAGWVVVSVPNPPAFVRKLASLDELTATAINRQHLPLSLVVTATQDAWIEVETDGHRANGRLLRAEETALFEASERIRIMTGNAPGLELRLNGAPVATAGVRRVRTLEFASEGARDLDSADRPQSSEPPVQALAATTRAVAPPRAE